LRDVLAHYLPSETDEDVLLKVFEQYGKVLRAMVQKDTGEEFASAFVTMDTRASAEAAMQNLDLVEFDGVPIMVTGANQGRD